MEPDDNDPVARRALDLARLLDDDARGAILDGALLRRRHQALGRAPSADAVQRVALAFRKARGLLKTAELDRWLAARALSRQGFAALMAAEARVLDALGEGGAVTPQEVLDYLRVAQGADALWTEAADQGVRPLPPRDHALRWFFEQHLGTRIPEDLEEVATQRDFGDSSDFVEAARWLCARRGPPAPAEAAAAPAPGDPAPPFALENHAVGTIRAELLAGRRAALVFAASLATEVGARCAQEAAARARALADAGWALLVLTPDSVEAQRTFVALHGLEALLLADPEGRVASRYGAPPGAVVELDPNGRIARVVRPGEPWGEAPATPAPEGVFRPRAPVLLVPDALDGDTCQALVGQWATEHHEGAVTALGARGAGAVVTQELKRRRDHTLAPSPLEQRVRGLLEARVFPEVEKGLQRAVALAEALRVGAYRAQDRGFFAAHRDDANAATGRRRFALAVNLNTGSYEGGRLTFPEYEDAMDVPRGCAVVYSVALLHAVSEVTHGARLALVGFLGDR